MIPLQRQRVKFHISYGKNEKVTLTKLNLVFRYCKRMFLEGIRTHWDVGIKVLHHAVLFLCCISKLDFFKIFNRS